MGLGGRLYGLMAVLRTRVTNTRPTRVTKSRLKAQLQVVTKSHEPPSIHITYFKPQCRYYHLFSRGYCEFVGYASTIVLEGPDTS